MADGLRVYVALALGTAERAEAIEALRGLGLEAVFVGTGQLLAEVLPHCEYLLLGRPPRLDWSPARQLRLLQIAGAGVIPNFPADALRESAAIANCRGSH